ncbi:aldehyde dehydrogenase domain-containing protein [Aspergillus californicus]
MSSVRITLPNGTQYDQPTGLFINNDFLDATGEVFNVIDPTTEETIVSLNGAGEADVDRAVAAARRAFEGGWRTFSATERGAFLYRLAELVHRDMEIIAAIDAYDNGKPFSAALSADLDESFNVFKYYAGWADKISGKTIETSPAKLAYVLQEPLGVCGQIIPWNFPFMMLAWKVAPALACGNVVVLKPAEQTPLSAMYFGKLVVEAGLPAGVVNIIPGLGYIAGRALAEHMGVDKIAFTGSTATGRAVMRAAAANLKNITLECGGKSPSIVFEDADLEQAVKWCHAGIMENQGQVCTSTSRVYVHEKIYDAFIARFIEVTKKNAKLGDPFADDIYQGPQVSKAQYDKILTYIERGKEEGATLLHGGVRHSSQGYFIEPTVFSNTTASMTIMREEIFGPVAAIAPFSREEEVIAWANDSSYGLAAAVFTEKTSRAHIVAGKIQAGMVWINSSGDSHYGIPFGGYKSSGIGRELGEYAIHAYTQSKAVHVNLGVRL